MRRPRRRTRWSLCLLLAQGPATGCMTISSYQSARMTEPGPSRPTFAVSTMGTSGDDGGRLTALDMRVRKSLSSNRSDMGFAASVLTAEGGALASIGIEPRVAVVPGVVALGAPVNWFVAMPLVQLTPGVIATVPLSRSFEINASARILVFAGEGVSPALPVYTLGFGVGEDLRRWAIRPEVAVMPWDDEEGRWLVQLGVGFEPPVPSSN